MKKAPCDMAQGVMVPPAMLHCKQHLKPWKSAVHCQIYPVGSALDLKKDSLCEKQTPAEAYACLPGCD